jgi:hypothetical protein
VEIGEEDDKVMNLTPGGPPTPPEEYIAIPSPLGYSLEDIKVIKDGETWDFRNKKWGVFEKCGGKRCRELLH